MKITIDAAVVQQAIAAMESMKQALADCDEQTSFNEDEAITTLRAAIEQAESVPPEFYGSEPWEYPNPEHIGWHVSFNNRESWTFYEHKALQNLPETAIKRKVYACAELVEQAEGQEPVGTWSDDLNDVIWSGDASHKLRDGQSIYTHPAQQEAELMQALSERDAYHDKADQLAEKIAQMTGADIGEHSSANCPWDRALDAADEWLAQPVQEPHHACKSDMRVNGGALKLALNSLRRGTQSQKEIADELEKTAQPALKPLTDDEATIAGLEASAGHLSALVDDLRILLGRSMHNFKILHAAASHDDGPSMDATIPAAVFASCVDEDAALLYEIRNGAHSGMIRPDTRYKFPEDQSIRAIAHHLKKNPPAYYDLALAREVIAEFCRLNGIKEQS
jgi:hypothetical protein